MKNLLIHNHLGNARILNSDTGDDIMQTLKLSSHQYIIALMLFLVAYSLFEAPSNLALKFLSPKRSSPQFPLIKSILTIS